MVGIPPSEKVIFKYGLLRKAIITDKAVYKKGIISSLKRYDFNDIICMFCEYERWENATHKSIKMILSNGKVVEFLSYSRSEATFIDYFFELLSFLGLGRTTERAISKAIKKNLPQGKLLFYERLPISLGEIDEMIKENRSPEEIRKEVQKRAEEVTESIKKAGRSPLGKAIDIALSLFSASAIALILAFPLSFFIGARAGLGGDKAYSLFVLLWLVLTALLTFPVYSRIKKSLEQL